MIVVTSASSSTSARAPSRRATPRMVRSASPRPGTPWNGTSARSPSGASEWASTVGTPASASAWGVPSAEPASALTSAAGTPRKCLSTATRTDSPTSGIVVALLYVGTPITISHGPTRSIWASTSSDR